MSSLTDRAAYLKGLAEGMNLDKDKNTHKLISEIILTLDEMAKTISDLSDSHEELNEYVESIDDDLADLEDVLFGDEDDDCGDDCDGCEDGSCAIADDEDDEDDADDEEEDEIAYNCPHCGHELVFNVSDIDFDEDTPCPACGKPIFPEVEELPDETDEE